MYAQQVDTGVAKVQALAEVERRQQAYEAGEPHPAAVRREGIAPDGDDERLGARRVGQFDEPAAGPLDEPLADLPPQRHQVAFRFALVHREEHIGVVERADGLRRNVIGVACPDTDDVDATGHAREYVSVPRPCFGGVPRRA